MAEHKLTLSAVQALKPGVVKWDKGTSGVRGFGVRRQRRDPHFFVKYRLHGKQRIYTIGRLGGTTRKLLLPCTVENARKEAEWARAEIAAGRDPLDHMNATTGGDTAGAVVADYIKRAVKTKGLRSEGAVEAMFENHVLPRWRTRTIKSIARQDVVKLLDEMVDEGKPIAAVKVRNHLSGLFKWLVGRGVLDASPVVMVPKPAVEGKRDRVLSDPEIATAWRAFAAEAYPFGDFMQMALALGQRRNEIAAMRFADIDEKAAVWTIPAEAYKSGRAHVVPLSPLALTILKRRKKEDRVGPYVFSTTGQTAISGFSKAKRHIDGAIAAEIAKLKAQGRDASKLFAEPWTLHDLRRTAATGMASLGASRFVVGRVLGHADAGVTGTYDRWEYLNEKRAALDAWGARLAEITTERRRYRTARQRRARASNEKWGKQRVSA